MSRDEKILETIRESIENEETFDLGQLELIQEYLTLHHEELPLDILEYLIESHKNVLINKHDYRSSFSEWENDEDYDAYH